MNKVYIYNRTDDDSLELSTRAFFTYEAGLSYLIDSVSDYLKDLDSNDYNYQRGQELLNHLNLIKKIKYTGNKFFGDANIYSEKGSDKDLKVYFVDFIEDGTELFSLEEIEIE